MNQEKANDEINLAELLFKLWAYKFLFVLIIFISVYASIFFINRSEKLYTSIGIFIPEENTTPNNIEDIAANNMQSLSRLAGIPNNAGNTEALIERFTGRQFVLELASELNLSDDQFFNTYNPNLPEPIWKAKLKSFLNWKSSSSSQAKLTEWSVLQNFEKHISMTKTLTGAVQINVDHANPERAAKIANHIMAKIISVLQSEKTQAMNERLYYLTQRLVDALVNYENAEKKLKNFMLSNNAVASQSFLDGSIQLEKLRTDQRENKNQIKAIDILLSYAQKSSPTFDDYVTLRNTYPLLDQSAFRRILGISETVSAWRWPSVDTLTRVRDSLRNRDDFLESEILKYGQKTIKYAISAEEQNKLTRELKIAETVYKVLTEQVKTQSLIAGFTPNTSRIIAKADVAIIESKPRKMLILAVAVAIGFFVSALLALILSLKKGVVYSSTELLKAINPKFYHVIHPIKYYRTSSLQELQKLINKRPAPWLKQLCLESFTNQGTSPIFVADTTNLDAASVIARLLAASAHKYDISVAYLDLSKTIESKNNKQDNQVSETKTNIEMTEAINGCIEYNYCSGTQNVDWLFSKSFQETIDFLNANHDIIILSANPDILDLVHASTKLFEAKLVIHASKGKTTHENIQKLNAQGNTEVALLS